MIRPATHDDIDVIIALGRKMHAESPRYSRLSFCPDKLRATLNQLLSIDDGIVLLYERGGQVIGGFMGFITTHWFSHELIANDLALFLDPNHRGGMAAVRLVKRYIEITKARGVDPEFIQIGISTGVHLEETEQLFSLIGLHKFGSLWRIK